MLNLVFQTPSGVRFDELFEIYKTSLDNASFLRSRKYILEKFTKKFCVERPILVKADERLIIFKLRATENMEFDIPSIFKGLAQDQKVDFLRKISTGLWKVFKTAPNDERLNLMEDLVKCLLTGSSSGCSLTRQAVYARLAAESAYSFLTTSATTDSSYARYDRSRENRQVKWKALTSWANSRSKDEIIDLHRQGQCINYNRLMQVLSDLMDKINESILQWGIYIPLSLRRGIPVVLHLDNFDIAKFHGTCVLSIQRAPKEGELRVPIGHDFIRSWLADIDYDIEFPSTSNLPMITNPFDEDGEDLVETSISLLNESLERSVTELKIEAVPLEPSLKDIRLPGFCPHFKSLRSTVDEWVTAFQERPISMIKFLSQNHDLIIPERSLVAIHPLSMQKPDLKICLESLQMACRIRDKCCPQMPLLVGGDQPIFAMLQKIIWAHPSEFPNTIPCMGLLHHQFALNRCIADFAKHSGLFELFNEARIIGSGQLNQLGDGKGHVVFVRNIFLALFAALETHLRSVHQR
ncbi:hypothetical protein Ciccas_006856 [Cichlidogyrus casuarinus]|uniref:Uncharacterized protein n=1 Tax=Cichlidogyrus casuarinus TaxID=1844966 RepID=A0ABD2Q8F9_9PLAT